MKHHSEPLVSRDTYTSAQTPFAVLHSLSLSGKYLWVSNGCLREFISWKLEEARSPDMGANAATQIHETNENCTLQTIFQLKLLNRKGNEEKEDQHIQGIFNVNLKYIILLHSLQIVCSYDHLSQIARNRNVNSQLSSGYNMQNGSIVKIWNSQHTKLSINIIFEVLQPFQKQQSKKDLSIDLENPTNEYQII